MVITAKEGGEEPTEDERALRLRRVIGYAAHLLPAQGPISIFVHHNTLHAYEYLPFEAAVVEAAELFGCEPFLGEAEYRQELQNGRIRLGDLQEVLAADLGSRAAESIARLTTRLQFRLGLLLHQVQDLRGQAFEWMLAEVAMPARTRTAHLWDACVSAARRHPEQQPAPGRAPVRHRDLLLAVTGADLDALVHPILIRVSAAFLDQGIAYWSMPDREDGLYRVFRRLYRSPRLAGEIWMRALANELEAQERDGKNAAEVVLECLDALGVSEREWEVFLARTLLALRGFAGMIHQIESRPDRVPVHAPPARLIDFLAVRLLLERFALPHLARSLPGWSGQPAALRPLLAALLSQTAGRNEKERAWLLFELARIHRWGEDDISALSTTEVGDLLREHDSFDEHERRRLLHLAYERRHRTEVLDAFCIRSTARAQAPSDPLRFQSIHCIDEREESLRRHLEEVEPACETFGVAGFFSVAMYYRGIGDAHATPLCPIAIRPQHEVEEAVAEDAEGAHKRGQARRRWLGLLSYETHVASRTFTRGALLTFLLGLGAAVPLTFRVLLPRWTARLRRQTGRLMQPPTNSRLLLEREERPVTLGRYAGFTVAEMADIVTTVLTDSGIARRFAPLVAVIGHGSSSLNNPHESAHDCGACGGGRGGPNARAFALMANDQRVRAAARQHGLDIPPTTYFVGVYHNTCDDVVEILDTEAIPAVHAGAVARLRAALDEARARTAHERCRRFDSAPLSLSPQQALAHVEARCEDLAQPRPEYGHATNSLCVVGRRSRTRGLFLDRRCFLISYDPQTDDAAGTILARVLAAAVPVAAGINLEYYFSRVDPDGYGCATKLPHNITALLGVMDGHASDLRTGLPWQMVEIHEPVRLLVLVEAEPQQLRRIVARNSDLARLVQNRWIQMAAWTPDAGEIWLFTRHGLTRHVPETAELPQVERSVDWYGGRRGFVPSARIAVEDRP
jgi:uncharacterized protein YbcC (UPF0753/DUF2309 family)